ncbi:SpoIIE family protein phosphatase [Candidatus Peregrinibacteria bacterium]|nr:SpoIIE family protein phosphatase [Candidatus Peregrinibacteria bacterium]
MKITIRSKLIIAISTLMVVLFAVAASLFVNEKKQEFAQDIYLNMLAFARLTGPTVAYDYDLYLAQNSFVYFNRDLAKIFKQNADVGAIKVISYQGELLYDSQIDVDEKYNGETRKISDDSLMSQVQSKNISLQTINGEILFLKPNDGGDLIFVDKNEKPAQALKQGTLLNYLMVPANDKYAIQYTFDYKNLNDRIERMRMRIIYLAVFGIMLGMLLSFIMSGQVTKPIAQLVEGADKIDKGDFTARVDIKTRDEMSFLGASFNQMAADLEKSIAAKIEQDRVKNELKIAGQIQDQLVPDDDEIPKIDGIQIAADLVPAEEIGGDIYDFIKIENRLVMYLGDVTGHGVPAGIISSISNALFYGFATLGDLKKILLEVNRVLKVKTLPTMFMTLCLMQWDAVAKKFSYASAGHEQILHYKTKEKIAEYKSAGGIALGMLPDISKHVNEMEIDFQTGDYLVIYSDGIPECWKNEKELYGPERLKAAMEKFGTLADADAVKKAILADVKAFAEGHQQMDDITIMVIKRT